ncbi:MAG: ABC transporter permease [Chthoniobacterales bacterium]
MVAAVALVLIPLGVSAMWRLGLLRDILVAGARMSGQLVLAGIYLQFLFDLNSSWLNLGWLLVMIVAAAASACRNSDLRWQRMLWPVGGATAISAVLVVMYFNAVIVQIDQLFDARYLVVISGMLLGNTMTGNIVALTHFFETARGRAELYRYRLAAGATREEALRPVYRESARRALRPMIASMMTMGIVSLPGMMTGQILGGASPVEAIKYQIAIMFAILAVMALGVVLALRFAAVAGFDSWGAVREDVFVGGRKLVRESTE